MGVSPEGQRKRQPLSTFLPLLTLNSPPSKILFSHLYSYHFHFPRRMAFVHLAQQVPVVREVLFSQGAGLVKMGAGTDFCHSGLV